MKTSKLKVIIVVFVIAIAVGAVTIPYFLYFYTTRKPKNSHLFTSAGVELMLQVMPEKNGSPLSAVNLYARKVDPDGSGWRWYYVEHESLSNNWKISYMPGDKSAKIMLNDSVISEIDLSNGLYYRNGHLHSRGEYLVVGNPEDQAYPVNKTKLPTEKWGW